MGKGKDAGAIAPATNTGQGQAPAPTPDAQDLAGNAFLADQVAYEPTEADISWIAGISDSYVREQIDGAFSEDALRKDVRKKASRKKGLSKADRDAWIEAQVNERMGETTRANKPKGESESLTGNQVFTGMDRRSGTEASRKDFVALGMGLFGSVEALREWYEAIGKADAPGGVYLHESARRRYEQARRDFQAEHPGWDFEPSYVGFQTRHRQHARNSLGLLSHFLGLAFDVVAPDNPHLVDADKRVLIETAGSEADGTTGASSLRFRKLGTDGQPDSDNVYGRKDYHTFRKRIEEAGKATAAGKPITGEAARLVGSELDHAYGRMAGTERRMHDVLDRDGDGAADELAELRAVAQQYWGSRREILARRSALQKAQSDLKKNAVSQAREAIVRDAKNAFEGAKASKLAMAGKKSFTRKEIAEDTDLAGLQKTWLDLRKSKKDIPLDQIQAHAVYRAYQARVDQAKASLDEVEGPIRKAKDRLLAPWYEKFDQRLAGYQQTIDQGNPAALKSLDKALSQLAAKKPKERDKALARIVSDPNLSPLLANLPNQELDTVKAALQGHRDKAKAAAAAQANHAVVAGTRSKLDNLDFVFGAKDALTFKDPSALQLAERGILWQGEQSPGHTKGVPATAGHEDEWMLEFTRTMMEHGFAPGAQWATADSMHFELVEGMNQFSGKGSSWGPKGAQ